MCQYKNFDFESVFKSFTAPIENIHAKLIKTTEVIPSEELQNKQIEQLSKIPCSFYPRIYTRLVKN